MIQVLVKTEDQNLHSQGDVIFLQSPRPSKFHTTFTVIILLLNDIFLRSTLSFFRGSEE